ncbi:MAG: hypothetical protein AAGI63_11465 [Planctomycetota bacterium]
MTHVKHLIESVCVLIFLVQTVQGSESRPHPVSVTQTYAYVTREAIDVKVQVFLEDLFLFHNLKPNDQDFLEPDILRSGVEAHKSFLLEKFVIRDLSGVAIPGRIVGVDELDLPAEGVSLGELMAHTLIFQLRYELPLAPEFLTVSQNFTDADGLIPSEMNLTVKQENGGEAYATTLKPDEPDTIRFNWNLPPLSAEASEEERQKWIAQQQEETLGITSYSSVYSFLYIDGYEVRHEILIPLLTLEDSVLIARDDDEFLDIAEQDAARQQIEAYFKTGNPIEIDGVSVQPLVERCDFYGLDFKDFAQQSERKDVSLASARVGIILTYPSISAPEVLKLTWNRFNNYVWTINMVVFAFEEVSKVTLSRLDSSNVFEWENPGQPERPPVEAVTAAPFEPSRWSLPILTLCCVVLCPIVLIGASSRASGTRGVTFAIVGLLIVAAAGWPFLRWDVANPFERSPAVSETESDSVFASLHQNLYQAFDYRNEEEIYDALAKSIDGELLEEVYLQIRRGLEMQEQGGAVSKIRDVEILAGMQQSRNSNTQERLNSEDGRQFRYTSRWNVAGTVEHWGHIHARTNQYEAAFDVEVRDGLWKITGMELLAEKRLSFETSLRSL